MADTWEVISGYSATDYVDTMTFEVDAETKKLAKLSGQTLVAGEKNSQYIQIKMPRYWDGIDISEMNIGIIYDLNNSEYFGTTQAISAERTTDSIRFGWVVPEEACAVKGTLLFVIIVKGTDYILKTQIADTPVVKSLSEDGDIPEPTKETWYADFQVRIERTLSSAENAVEEAQAVLEQARSFVGSPLVAETAAGMVDTDRIYVYTGSETGYTTGNWYYYNTGTSAWTSGGVYNAVAVDTDTTLTIAGKPADSKKTGDEISQIKEDFTAMVNSAYVTDSADGSIAHFVDGADDIPMKSVKVNIAPVQSGSGDPSPSNVRAISGWNSVKVTRSGKNLAQPLSKTESGLTLTPQADGSLHINGTFSGTTGWFVISKNFLVKANQTYALSISGTTNTFGLNGFGSTNPVTPTADFTTNLRLRIENGQTFNNAVIRPQVEVGASATDFEPYIDSTSYDISLASAGTVYGGTLDVVSGELTVDRGIITLDGSQTITESQVKRFYVSIPDARQITAENQSTDDSVISERFKSYTWSALSNATDGCAPVYGFGVGFRNPNITDVASWTAFFRENPTKFSYMLATPLIYQLSATEIKSLLGINNVWSDAGDTACEYRADTKLYIDKKLGV